MTGPPPPRLRNSKVSEIQNILGTKYQKHLTNINVQRVAARQASSTVVSEVVCCLKKTPAKDYNQVTRTLLIKGIRNTSGYASFKRMGLSDISQNCALMKRDDYRCTDKCISYCPIKLTRGAAKKERLIRWHYVWNIPPLSPIPRRSCWSKGEKALLVNDPELSHSSDVV